MDGGSGAAWGSVVTGLASVATIPLAIYLTRFSDTYELVHAGFAIPVAAAFAFLALALARRSRRRQLLRVGPGPRRTSAVVGRVLGVVGLSLAASGVVALVVYGLLEYVGSRG